MEFIEVLIQKAMQGLKVRMLCDAAGSHTLFRSFSLLSRMEEAGIHISFFNSFIIGRPGHYSTWFFRDHSKLLIIDSEHAYTGGVCIAGDMSNWRDTMVQIGGSVVAEMEEAFREMWHRSEKTTYNRRLMARSESDFHYHINAPLPKKRALYWALIEAIRQAKHYVYLTTPYFLPDRRLIRVLRLASRRGVDVRLLLPENSNHAIVDLASSSYYDELLRSNIRIFKYSERMIHAKTAAIDDEWSTVGSMNLDNISLRYNFEGNLISFDQKFCEDVKGQFLIDIAHTAEIDPQDWAKRPWLYRLFETLAFPFRKIL